MKAVLDLIRGLVRPVATVFLLMLAGGVAAYAVIDGGGQAERAFVFLTDASLLVLGFWFGGRSGKPVK